MVDVTRETERMAGQAAEGTREAAHRVGERASETFDRIQEAGGRAARAAQEGAAQVRERAGEYFEQGRERVQEMGEDLQSAIEQRPMTSILIAAACGFVLGWMFVRR